MMNLRAPFSLIVGLSLIETAFAASLDAPDEAPIGSTIEVTWDGPGDDYDSVYVVKTGAADAAEGIHSSSILSRKNPLPLMMAEEPGDYELRYWNRAQAQIIARRPIAIVDVAASLEAPAVAKIGETIEVTWTGPGNQYDRIDLFEPDAGDDAAPLVGIGITSKKNPVQLRLPEFPGDYEIHYRTARIKRTLITKPLTIEAVDSSLTAPEKADIGANIEVTWEGPGNPYDRINLYETGSSDDARPIVGGSILSRKNPISFKLPEEAGKYELRYVTAQSGRVLARRPLQIGGVEASLEAPEWATASTQILVGWEGPGNDYDQIVLALPDAADDAEPLARAVILSGRDPVPLELPEQEGDFELRYRTAQTGSVLARRPIAIQPAGRLAVVFERDREITVDGGNEPHQGATGTGAVELILDASGSMLQREGGARRIEIAREVLINLVLEHLPEDRHFALRVFGHKEPDKCRTDLEIPLGPLDRAAAATRIGLVNAMNLAKTPIADSLARVPADLAGASGPKTVILITDGEETCDGDPAAVISQLRDQGLDVQISIVGFAIDDPNLKAEFETWAELGGGSYFDARSAEELTRSLRSVISGPFRVIDAEGKVAGQGVIGGAEIVLPAGIYRVETVSDSPQVIENVEIKPRELTRAAF